MALVVDEPDLGFAVVMGREPGSPGGAGGGVEGGHLFFGLTSDNIFFTNSYYYDY
jgi:hypothetical protein